MSPKILLLMGPPGVGKSTLITALNSIDLRFSYIRPYTTRDLRNGEIDKVHVSESEMQRLWESAELLIVNELYGYRYGTPKSPINLALASSQFPVIDWPVTHIADIARHFPGKVFRVYLAPPSFEILAERLEGRTDRAVRLDAARKELAALERAEFDGSIDIQLTSFDGQIESLAALICQKYLEAIAC